MFSCRRQSGMLSELICLFLLSRLQLVVCIRSSLSPVFRLVEVTALVVTQTDSCFTKATAVAAAAGGAHSSAEEKGSSSSYMASMRFLPCSLAVRSSFLSCQKASSAAASAACVFIQGTASSSSSSSAATSDLRPQSSKRRKRE
jgi:hypothetical protein